MYNTQMRARARRAVKVRGKGCNGNVHRCRPSWKPKTDDDPGVGGCAGALEGPADGGWEERPQVPLGVADRIAVAAIPVKCGVAGGLECDGPDETGVRPRIRCTMNGGTVCEPACELPRWCVGRVGDDGPALGSGGCGGRWEPLRRYAEARRDSIGEAIDEWVEWRK